MTAQDKTFLESILAIAAACFVSGFWIRRKEGRSEERRGGKECRSRWSPYHLKNRRQAGGLGFRMDCQRRRRLAGGGAADAFEACARGVFFSSRSRHTRLQGEWSSDVCSSDLSRAMTPTIAFRRNCICMNLLPSDVFNQCQIGRPRCRKGGSTSWFADHLEK